MPPDAIPAGLLNDPDYLGVRRQVGAENVQAVHDEQRERILFPERNAERSRNEEEVINVLEHMSWEQLRERDLEQKYGRGPLGTWRRFINGEHDVSVDRAGNVRRHWWTELGRRALATVFNRRTLFGAGALAVVGFFTGGAGLPALGAFFGGLAGKAGAEGWAFGKGEEWQARAELLKAEAERAIQLKQLAYEYQRTGNVERRGQLIKEIVDGFHGASQDALAERQKLARERLVDVQKRNTDLRNSLELWGTLGGLAGGLGAAHAAAQLGVEGGRLAFGGVDTDFDGVMHSVAKIDGQWQFAYNNMGEVANTILGDLQGGVWPPGIEASGDPSHWLTNVGGALPATVTGMSANAGYGFTHVLEAAGNETWWKVPLVYAEATAKALSVIGAMGLATLTEPASAAAEERRKTQLREDEAAAHKRVLETIGKAKPTPEQPTIPVVPTVGETWGVATMPPATTFVTIGLPQPVGWDPRWQFVRVNKLITDPTTNRETGVTLDFYRSEHDLRSGKAAITYDLPPDQYAHLRQVLGEEGLTRPVSDQDRRKLEKTEARDKLEAAVGKQLVFFPRIQPEKLRILVNEHGWPIPGTLDARAKYTLHAYDLEKNIAHLRDQATGNIIFVDLLRLQGAFEKIEEVTPESGQKSVDSNKAEIQEIRRELQARRQAMPVTDQVWVLESGSIEGEIAVGDNKGFDDAVTPGSYLITEVRLADKKLVLSSLTDPTKSQIEVDLAAFAKATGMKNEDTRIGEIFAEKSARGELVPANNDVSEGQVYNFQFPGTGAVKDYEVTALAAGKKQAAQKGLIQVTQLTAAGARTQTKRWIDRAQLAASARYVRG